MTKSTRLLIILALSAGGIGLMGLTLTASAAPAQVHIYPGAPLCPTTLQACIDAVNPGDEIRLQPGTYVTSVTLSRAVSLVRNDAGGPGPAILQAPPGQRALIISGSVPGSVQIAHLTIQGASLPTGNGGGVLVLAPAQPNLHDLLIQSNTVSAANAIGGGLFTSSTLTLTNVTFRNNVSAAGDGGALGTGPAAEVTLINSTFENNRTADDGGGLYAGDAATVVGGAFRGNSSTGGGGGAIYALGSLTVDSTVISGSQAFDSGGGVLAGAALAMNNALVTENASTGGSGAGVRAVGPATISGTQFISNTAFNPGGGLRTSVAVILTNTDFISNTSLESGGGLRANAEATLSGGRFVANTADEGGGVLVQGELWVEGTWVSSNTALFRGGGLDAVTATIHAATFDRNRTEVGNGGGLHVSNMLSLSESLFTANAVLSGTAPNATGTGGGLFSDGVLTSTDNIFVGNFAFRLGGGADVDDTVSTHDQFRGNLTGPQGSGGGLFAAGVLDLDSGLFFTNTANTAGGLGVNSTGSGEIRNSLFARNAVTFTDGGTAMRLLSTSGVSLIHNTLVGTAAPSRAAVFMTNSGVFTFYNNILTQHAQGLKNSGTMTATEDFNLFFAVTIPRVGLVTAGASSLTGDPQFADAAADDFHLGAGSPAIGAGLPQGVDHDFEGQPRPLLAGVDIGFDEAWQVELGLSKASQPASVAPGASLTYTLVVTNAGPLPAVGAVLSDALPAALTSAAWTCQATPGSSCPASGNGNVLADVDLAVGGRVTITVQATVSLSASGSLTNTASVSVPASTPDVVPANNSATALTAILPRLFLPLVTH